MEYEIIRSGRKTLAAQIKNGRLVVRAPRQATDGEICAFVQRNRRWIETHLEKARQQQTQLEAIPKLTQAQLAALKAQAAQIIGARTAYYAAQMGVSYGKITIRCQRTRWGSCSARGDLSFNCLLLLAPPEVLDSVVVHELAHRRLMNHSPAFYEQVLRVMPDYPQRRRWLKEHGPALLAQAGKTAPESGAVK